MTKAQTVTFIYAGQDIEGLLLPNGEYRIAMSQIKSLILAEKNYNTKQLQAMTGVPFEPRKVASDLNNNKAVTVSLSEFSKICLAIAIKHPDKFPVAVSIAEISVNFTITQAFEVALGVKKTNLDGVKMFEEMMSSKLARRNVTDVFKEVYDLTGCFPAYGKHTLMLYKQLELMDKYNEYLKQFGKKSKHTFRHDYLGRNDRNRITDAETNIRFMIGTLGMDLEDAIAKIQP